MNIEYKVECIPGPQLLVSYVMQNLQENEHQRINTRDEIVKSRSVLSWSPQSSVLAASVFNFRREKQSIPCYFIVMAIQISDPDGGGIYCIIESFGKPLLALYSGDHFPPPTPILFSLISCEPGVHTFHREKWSFMKRILGKKWHVSITSRNALFNTKPSVVSLRYAFCIL